MKTLTDKQAENLLLILDCIEAWGVNSDGCNQLWTQYKDEIEEQLYGNEEIVAKLESMKNEKTVTFGSSEGARKHLKKLMEPAPECAHQYDKNEFTGEMYHCWKCGMNKPKEPARECEHEWTENFNYERKRICTKCLEKEAPMEHCTCTATEAYAFKGHKEGCPMKQGWCEHIKKLGHEWADGLRPVPYTINFCPYCAAPRPEPRKALADILEHEAKKLLPKEMTDRLSYAHVFECQSIAALDAVLEIVNEFNSPIPKNQFLKRFEELRGK